MYQWIFLFVFQCMTSRSLRHWVVLDYHFAESIKYIYIYIYFFNTVKLLTNNMQGFISKIVLFNNTGDRVWSSAILKGVALTSVFWSWQVIKTVSRGGWLDRTMALSAALTKFDFCKSWEAFDWFTQSKRESHVQNLSV